MTDSVTTPQAIADASASSMLFLPCSRKGQHERLTECWVCWSDEIEQPVRQEQNQAEDSSGNQVETAPPPAVRIDLVLSYVRELGERITGRRPTESIFGDPAVAIVIDGNLITLEVLNPPDPFHR